MVDLGTPHGVKYLGLQRIITGPLGGAGSSLTEEVAAASS